MKKILALVMVLVLALGMFAGCKAEKKNNTLVYGSGDYDSINPIMNEHCEIKHLLFDGLVSRDAKGNIVPALAESWSYNAPTMTYTFKLRSNVKLHDGDAFIA